jgi:hypothetical protein
MRRFLRQALPGPATTAGPRRPSIRRPLALEQLESREVLTGYTPTAYEQLVLERLNDARANPAAYGQSIGFDLSGIAPSQPWPSTRR